MALSTSTPITATVRVPRVASKAARGDRGDVFELIKVEQVQVRWQHDLGLDRMRREDMGLADGFKGRPIILLEEVWRGQREIIDPPLSSERRPVPHMGTILPFLSPFASTSS